MYANIDVSAGGQYRSIISANRCIGRALDQTITPLYFRPVVHRHEICRRIITWNLLSLFTTSYSKAKFCTASKKRKLHISTRWKSLGEKKSLQACFMYWRNLILEYAKLCEFLLNFNLLPFRALTFSTSPLWGGTRSSLPAYFLAFDSVLLLFSSLWTSSSGRTSLRNFSLKPSAQHFISKKLNLDSI